MIYKRNGSVVTIKKSFAEDVIMDLPEPLLEFEGLIDKKYTVQFQGYNKLNMPPHGPRFKFVSFDREVSISMLENEKCIDLTTSHYPSSRTGKSNAREAIDISCALAEILGEEYVKYYYDNNPQNEINLKERIKEFNKMPSSEKRKYRDIGRSKMKGKMPL